MSLENFLFPSLSLSLYVLSLVAFYSFIYLHIQSKFIFHQKNSNMYFISLLQCIFLVFVFVVCFQFNHLFSLSLVLLSSSKYLNVFLFYLFTLRKNMASNRTNKTSSRYVINYYLLLVYNCKQN